MNTEINMGAILKVIGDLETSKCQMVGMIDKLNQIIRDKDLKIETLQDEIQELKNTEKKAPLKPVGKESA